MDERRLKRLGLIFGCTVPLLILLLLLNNWFYSHPSRSTDWGMVWIPYYLLIWAAGFLGSVYWWILAISYRKKFQRPSILLYCLNTLPTLLLAYYVWMQLRNN